MQVTTQVGLEKDYRLTKAILLYEDVAARHGAFATVHGITSADVSRAPSLGPGQLLTTKFLESLYQSLRAEPKAVLLPTNVLAYTSDLLIWWTGPRLHPMYFSAGAEDCASVHGRTCPHPSLVWKVHRGQLALRALSSNVRPLPETELMVAPYWNTEVRTGNVCEGDMPRPRETNFSNMTEWEEGFFNSRFTHPSGIGMLTRHAHGFMGLWTELAGAAQFPEKYLVGNGQTLLEFTKQN